MNFPDHYYFGIIHKTIGLNGVLAIKVDVDDISKYKKLDHLFVLDNNQLVPFFITSLIVKNNDVIQVQFDGLNTITSTERLIGKQVYLPIAMLPKLSGNKFYYHEIIGYSVIDSNHGNIGIVQKVLDFTHQDILEIKQNYTEILVPILDHIIKKVDRDKKELHIEAPEGLIDIYTNPNKNNEEEE